MLEWLPNQESSSVNIIPKACQQLRQRINMNDAKKISLIIAALICDGLVMTWNKFCEYSSRHLDNMGYEGCLHIATYTCCSAK